MVMNILFLAVDVDLRRNRGDSIHVQELTDHLVGLGHHVVLVTSTPDHAVSTGIVHATAPASTPGQISLGWRLARRWADVIYERRVSPKLSFTISKLSRTPFVLEVNGVLEDEVENPPSNRWRPLRLKIRGSMIRRASKIIAVSDGIRRDLLTRYAIPSDRIAVVPNGVSPERFFPSEKTSCRTSLGLRPSDQVVCYIGNMARWQGVDLLMDAADTLHSRRSSIKLLLAGDGPELQDLKAKAKGRNLGFVDFLGPVSYDRIPEIIGASDVAVAPLARNRKASPLKVFEYMACGRPIVVSDVDEVGNFVRMSGCGIVVNPGDPDGLADAIEWLLSHPEQAEAMGVKGRVAIIQGGTWEASARRTSLVLAGVVRKRQGVQGRTHEGTAYRRAT